jgi:hypothetical protein
MTVADFAQTTMAIISIAASSCSCSACNNGKLEQYDYYEPREPHPDLSYLYVAPRSQHRARPLLQHRSAPRWKRGRWRAKT